jgi:glucose dehydrogenase
MMRWVTVFVAGTLAFAQSSKKDVEWPSYTADLAGTRYRPLDQINASNFSKLEVAWKFKTDNIGNRPEYKLEGTPLMINGVVYVAVSGGPYSGEYIAFTLPSTDDHTEGSK